MRKVIPTGLPAKEGRQGFTLVELLVVITIIILLALMMVGALDPAQLTGRARDSRRKKDIGRIKVAFEEYYNDKECYPDRVQIEKLSCGGKEFSPILNSWPCDPLGVGITYTIVVAPGTCPQNYKIMTNLENKSDPQIPNGWYLPSNTTFYGDGTLTSKQINYGVSSGSVSWNDTTEIAREGCPSFGGCYIVSQATGSCTSVNASQGPMEAYLDFDCTAKCKVSCCYQGKICK